LRFSWVIAILYFFFFEVQSICEEFPFEQRMLSHFEMYNGVKIPSVGLGTWQMEDEHEVKQTIYTSVVDLNYKHIDTASIYRNEKYIGDELVHIAKKVANFDVDSIFVTSKIPPTKTHCYDSVIQCFEKSCRNLQRSCIDLCLIHWPGTSKVRANSAKNKEFRLQTWYALEKLYRDKRVRAIGVSNFMPKHLDNEFFEKISICPMLNSIEYHPLIWNCPEYNMLEQICKQKNILIQAYSPLAQGEIFKKKLQIDTKSKDEIACKILQWALLKGKGVIPRSTNPKHLKANIDVLNNPVLSDFEIKTIDSMYCNERTCWNPLLIS